MRLTTAEFSAFVAVATRASDVLFGGPLDRPYYEEQLGEALRRLKATIPDMVLREPDNSAGSQQQGVLPD